MENPAGGVASVQSSEAMSRSHDPLPGSMPSSRPGLPATGRRCGRRARGAPPPGEGASHEMHRPLATRLARASFMTVPGSGERGTGGDWQEPPGPLSQTTLAAASCGRQGARGSGPESAFPGPRDRCGPAAARLHVRAAALTRPGARHTGAS